MGLGTMTSREMHRSDSGQMLFAPQYPARAPEVNYAKETSYSINQLERRNRLEREGSTESKSASPVPSSKASSVSGHTTASMASYRETKNYLLKQGFTSREVLDAPTSPKQAGTPLSPRSPGRGRGTQRKGGGRVA